MNKNILLFLMLIAYSIPISYVCFYYNCNCSISHIISDNIIIFVFMIFMGFFTILYEIERNDFYSLFFISLLLIGIYGVILYNNNHSYHYYFACLSFISILFFMIYNSFVIYDSFLFLLLLLQCILLLLLFFNYNHGDFIHIESVYIFLFAIFYIYLHVISI